MESSSIFLSAGDPSGDIAAAKLVSALRSIMPHLKLSGLGGNRLRQQGQDQLAEPDDLAVLGFWEVAKRFGFFRTLLSRAAAHIAETKPKAIVLVDYPGFNLRLARRVKDLGIPIIYYISPQIWAWGKRRLKAIRELVDLMLVILPFETDFYAGTGVKTEFVGHYLLEDIPGEYISSPVPVNDPPHLAILPGSRTQEIERMLPAMLRTATMFGHKYGGRITIAGIKNRFDYAACLKANAGEGIEISFEDSRKVICDSSLVLTSSGTATLETAIVGRPMVVVYKTGFLSYHIARWLVKLDRVALANLVLGEKVVPELIQQEASPETMMRALERYMADDTYRVGVTEKLNRVPGLLGGAGASRRAAELVSQFLN
ncbi:MAG: lipid-A-disaccharide synthase [Candidatus Zixiibacteriota bacterium]|nr:MAG: lipid-A-disaccharide synthase [candidate division Zixibacteria bacterium]